MQSLEVWLEKHNEALIPFRNFLKKHDADEQRTIAFLYKIGYWGHRTMLHKATTPDGGYMHEQAFKEWTEALAVEDVPISAPELIKQWPGMLARPASNLPSTFAILKAAIPNEDDLRFVLNKVPKALGHTPLSLQNRLLKLQLATAGELKDLLVTNPRLLELKLEDILSNVRLLRQNSRSLMIFKQLLEHRPDLATWRPHDLERRLRGACAALTNVLPQGINPEEVIKAKPLLFLLKPGMLTDRWTFIQEATQLLPQWAEELQTIVDHATSMPAGNTLDPKVSGAGGESAGPLVPESPRDLGVGTAPLPVNVPGNEEFVFDSELEGESESMFSEEQRAGRKAYSAISEMLWTRERRLQRLRYLAQELPEEAETMSFLSVLLVSLERFQRRFPYFWRWRRDNGLLEVRQDVNHQDEHEMHG